MYKFDYQNSNFMCPHVSGSRMENPDTATWQIPVLSGDCNDDSCDCGQPCDNSESEKNCVVSKYWTGWDDTDEVTKDLSGNEVRWHSYSLGSFDSGNSDSGEAASLLDITVGSGSAVNYHLDYDGSFVPTSTPTNYQSQIETFFTDKRIVTPDVGLYNSVHGSEPDATTYCVV
eukprot:UN28609